MPEGRDVADAAIANGEMGKLGEPPDGFERTNAGLPRAGVEVELVQ